MSRRGFSQAKGFNEVTISRLCNRREVASPATLARLAAALGVHADEAHTLQQDVVLTPSFPSATK